MAKNRSSKSWQLAEKIIFAALQILKENEGQLQGKQVIEEVEKRVDLDDWAKARYEKSGYIRWRSVLHFYTIDCIKAGFLLKNKGIWYLTPEGEKALDLGESQLLKDATQAFKQWKAEKENSTILAHDSEINHELEVDNDVDNVSEVTISEYEEIAVEGLKKFVRNLNAYEFQDLVAALLRGMGYYTPFIAPKGKDGGLDVIAYQDPLGTVSPRIKVQIKHRESPASVDEIRQLRGVLQKDGDVGIFVSTGGFTSDAKNETRSSHTHIELIDFGRFISLWQQFYEKLPDEDKKRLPLTPIYFLGI
ncbi:restriction endonuclease [Anabaena sp. FACHB-1237]|uniref:restriction endonuclease n=1 Tax=Anabaena sp. FACHB-1237 TaxID=2692769 RepID=UPI00167FF0F8|nr:restriction endonuclease [Anabaena sp. FACHB-1237]MBD2137656.1 restriction endonuclease [Anabaena sp. FACHB-1237]